MPKKIKLALIFGGTSDERRVSLVSAKSVFENLDKKKYLIEKIEVTPNPDWLIKSLKRLSSCDAALLVLHGPGGEDGTIQGLLEVLNIPYSGSGLLSAALTMNKYFTNIFVQQLGLKVPRSQLVKKGVKLNLKSFGNKLFVKPNSMGSSLGANLATAKNIKNALKIAYQYDKEALVQEFITGREITVSVIGRKDARVLAVAEIISHTNASFWDYKAKYLEGGADHIIPAALNAEQTKKVKQLALKVHTSLSCGGATRVDFILDKKGDLYFLEINTIPGMTKYSLVPQSAESTGLHYSELLDKLVQLAFERI